ncbi:F0F1 ATP synthase subunit gamma [Tumidithrix elongata RA019]|uniref:F0F1 ATP synthase subunit gamma n=1 Tax=Tumidithrix elongata BACA0141 TaxID=2716417 RepID=A0AAW9Q3A2_9CYAN|nr:F0F1 ATP synthase subunit gamma [Tumidithrix elongata RA019]
MTSIQSLQRQIHTATDLRSVVKMMKVLAAVNIHQYEQAVASLSEYSQTIEKGLYVVLKTMHPQGFIQANGIHEPLKSTPFALTQFSGKRCGAIVFGSEQGMCGQFNEQIARYAIAEIQHAEIAADRLSVFTVGTRIIPPLETAGFAIAQTFEMPSSLAGITPMVQEMLIQIETWRDRDRIDRILLFYNRLHASTFSEPSKLQLLPLDRQWLQTIAQRTWQSRSLPTFTMASDRLFASLLRQYFFISLYRAFVESLASENASRLASMQIAEKNIEERIAEFTIAYQQERQTAITAELLEIVTAY